MSNDPDPQSSPPSAAARPLQQALALHQRGELAQAESAYLALLAANPEDADALHWLGVARFQQGDLAHAANLIGRALAANPRLAAAHAHLGLVLAESDRPDDALASFDRALALVPDDPATASNRGNLLLSLGRTQEALAAFEHALALDPALADALNNRGIALFELGRTDEALASYDAALALQPNDASFHYNRGNALREQGRDAEALAGYDASLALLPDDPATMYHRGNALAALKRPAEALEAYDRTLAQTPGDVAALYNRGNALAELGRRSEALASYNRVVAVAPDHVAALNNRGNMLLESKRAADALASYERALALDPAHRDARNNRANALREAKRYVEAARAFGELLSAVPPYDYAPGSLFDCERHACDWSHYDERLASVEAAVERGERAAVPFYFVTASGSPALQLACARTYAADRYPPSSAPLSTGERYGHDRIRIAYLSADFHDHATAYLMAELFERHDRNRFETTAYSFGPDAAGGMRERLRRAFDRFVDVREMSDRDVARMMREQEIDIAVDLKGYTVDARTGILVQRPAPVQVSYLGYPGTMGLDCIDYLIADAHVIPPEHDLHYAERIVRLPGSYQVNDGQRAIAAMTPTRADVGLPATGFVFCCFNNTWKIAPDVFSLWMRLLHAVPGSVLWLLDDNPIATTSLRREAAARGVASERLIFAPRMPLPEHLARHRLADLFLDTLPCNAHTTASDALWAGLPLLTCTGSAFCGRVATSLLHAVELPELIATSLAEYEAIALRLASSPAMLAEVRERLARNRTSASLFDAERFRRHLEAAYMAMWERSERGEGPAAFTVAPQ
jgi:predicted O-linked N-acetylglucosamine transferase (SPINDLY family)